MVLKYILFYITLLFVATQLVAQQSSIKYTGSSTIGNFIQDAAAQYDKSDFIIDVSVESVGGEMAILEGRTDLAGTAKIPGANIAAAGIQSSLMGWDAIAVIVNQSNPVQNLTQTQLKDIFTGRVKNWSEVGGSDLPIKPFIVDIESATRKVFRSKILAEADYQDCEVVSPDVDIIKNVQNEPGAIGTISYSFLKSLDRIKSIAVNGQSLSLTNVNYPITRPLYLLWRGENQKVSTFVAWSNSVVGQRLVMQRFIGNREGQNEIVDEPGTLLVYSQTTVFEDGGIYYYPHSAYNILSTDRKLLAHVNNHLSNNDENPTRINLRSGTYLIQSEIEPIVERFVTIQSGKLSKLKLTEIIDPASDESAKPQSIISTDASQNKFDFLDPYGDLRFRLEEDVREDFNRFRARFRVRAGLSASISPSVKLDIRLSSTNDPNDPNSTHVNADDGFNQIDIIIDRAYLQINPKAFKQFHLWLGKFPHRFTNSSLFSENVWDDDIQPEGGAFSITLRPSGIFNRLRLYNGFYLESQFASNSEKDWLNTTQISADLTLSKNVKFTLASGLYFHANIKDHAVQTQFFDNNGGNSTYVIDDLEYYQNDFHILDNFALFTWNALPNPLVIKSQFITNISAENNDSGYVLGIMYGELQNKNDWRIHYQYQHIERDAVFTPFVNDDFLRQTNFSGHTAGIAYAFNDKISLQLWTLIDSSLTGPANKQQRFRLDLNAKL